MNTQQIAEVERIIGYTFYNKELLIQAYTRKSYVEENRGELHNELLETLGDATISFYVTHTLISKYRKDPFLTRGLRTEIDESDLTRMRKEIVCGKNLAKHAVRLGLANPEFMRMSKGERQNKIFAEQKVQEDLFESIIGAIAVDIDVCKIPPENIFADIRRCDNTICQNGLITRLLELDSPGAYNVRPIAEAIDIEENKNCGGDNFNPINYLLELYQAKKIPIVIYEEMDWNESGWTCSASIPEKGLVFMSTGKSKKEAKLLAATKLYKAITTTKSTLRVGDWVQIISDMYEKIGILKGMIGKIISPTANGQWLVNVYEPNDEGYDEDELIVSGNVKETDLQIYIKIKEE